jgi:ribosomal protein S18 acetylase RimI-like enzyme
MLVREIKKEDCQNLAALSIYVWLHTYAGDGIRDEISKFVLSTFTKNEFEKIVKSPTKRGFVVNSGQHLIGIVIINLDSYFDQLPQFGYEIETLYVHPSFQRRGVGKRILEYLRKSVGYKSWLTTWVHNYNALEFYRKNGYRIVGEAEFILSDENHINHVLSNK